MGVRRAKAHTHKRHWSQIYGWQHTDEKRTVDSRNSTDTTNKNR